MFYLFAISVTSPCPESTVKELEIKNWPVCTFKPSSFDWTPYDKQIFLLLEGEFQVTPDRGESAKFGKGDLVVFLVGMNYRLDVYKTVRKHYSFGV
jgi:hypothetical protein